MIRLGGFLVLAAAAAGYALWVYRRAELPVRGSTGLALLRSAALIIVLALLFDLRLPWGGGVGDGRRWVLLDVSASMDAGDGEAWRAALDRARALESDGWQVVPFGASVGQPGSDGLSPSALSTELEPAVVRAAEAGVSEVRVISDLRFQDPVAATAALAFTPLRVAFEGVGSPLLNAGISSFTVLDQGRRGDPVAAELEYFGGGPTDSIQVEVREEGELVASVPVPPATPGRRGRVTLELPAPRGEGRLRYAASVVLAGDGFEADDEALAYMNAGHEAGGLVVVSLRPDWEPRALLSALADATGLSATGYLRAGPDRFVPMGRAIQRGAAVDSATVGAAAAEAALLVVHGVDAGTDAWGRSLAARSGRMLVWPGDAVGAGAAAVPAGAALDGEWYAAPDVPPSPMAADLAGARLQDLPPLSRLLPLDADVRSRSPLLVQLGGTGPGRPPLYLDEAHGGRRVAALASGFWRWAAREGAGLDAYRRLWSGVAGWLLEEDPLVSYTEVRPERWVSPSGEPVTWWVPGAEERTVRIQVTDDQGRPVADTVVSVPQASIGVLPPGSYRYVAHDGDDEVGAGRFDVEARSEEMLPPARALEVPAASVAASPTPVSGGRPLRTWPWPYLLLLVLLSVEWVGRRRAGLR